MPSFGNIAIPVLTQGAGGLAQMYGAQERQQKLDRAQQGYVAALQGAAKDNPSLKFLADAAAQNPTIADQLWGSAAAMVPKLVEQWQQAMGGQLIASQFGLNGTGGAAAGSGAPTAPMGVSGPSGGRFGLNGTGGAATGSGAPTAPMGVSGGRFGLNANQMSALRGLSPADQATVVRALSSGDLRQIAAARDTLGPVGAPGSNPQVAALDRQIQALNQQRMAISTRGMALGVDTSPMEKYVDAQIKDLQQQRGELTRLQNAETLARFNVSIKPRELPPSTLVEGRGGGKEGIINVPRTGRESIGTPTFTPFGEGVIRAKADEKEPRLSPGDMPIAAALGLSMDPTKWTPEQARAFGVDKAKFGKPTPPGKEKGYINKPPIEGETFGTDPITGLVYDLGAAKPKGTGAMSYFSGTRPPSPERIRQLIINLTKAGGVELRQRPGGQIEARGIDGKVYHLTADGSWDAGRSK